MLIKDKNIDKGKAFDWGRTSSDYAKYRDIYPKEFYDKIIKRKLCIKGQSVLDIGTGTGVIPRNLYHYVAEWTAADISENQIEQAKLLSIGKKINYFVSSTEDLNFPNETFDIITACQCFWYFKHKVTAPNFHKILKKEGRFLILYMAWLPFDDKIARASEDLVLKYSPNWSGGRETIHQIQIPEIYNEYFQLVHHEEFPLKVHFTRESWNGRIKACRGIGASLSKEEIVAWETEHRELLKQIAPEEFDVLHYAAIAELKKK